MGWYGAYVSQGWVRRLPAQNDKDDALELLIDWSRDRDIHTVVKMLGFQTKRWYTDTDGENVREGCNAESEGHSDEGFPNWLGCMTSKGHPVVTGVVLEHSKTREYDHIVLALSGERNGTIAINDMYAAGSMEVS